MSNRDEDREQEQKGFRVVDRRRFTATGELRPEAQAEPEPAQQRAPREEQAAGARRGPTAAGAQPGIDFITFAASLATNALAAMGALPDAEARGLPRSPELAREYIEILAMLQDKTRGNLTPQEDQALQQMLTELRLQFVEATRRR